MPLNVIGGEWGGRKLKSPPAGVRPTSAILRRSLFDILGPSIIGTSVLDLYAGAGTLGLEALSRGAATCDFVERDGRTASVLRDNLERLAGEGGGGRGRVHSGSVERWLERSAGQLREVDLVLLDPPYGDPGRAAVLATLGRPGTLAAGTLVVAEQGSGEASPLVQGLSQTRRVDHGDSSLVMLRAGA